MDAVQQPVPAVVRGAERRPLGQEPARERVGDVRGAVGRSHLYPHQAVKHILPFPGPEPERPLVDGREAAGLGRIDRGAMARRQPQVALEVVPVEGQRRMALGDAEHARIGGPARALGQRSVHDQPAVGPAAGSARRARAPARRAPGRAPGRHWPGRAPDAAARRREARPCRKPSGSSPAAASAAGRAMSEQPPLLEHRDEPPVVPLAHRRRDLAHHDGRGPRIGHAAPSAARRRERRASPARARPRRRHARPASRPRAAAPAGYRPPRCARRWPREPRRRA